MTSIAGFHDIRHFHRWLPWQPMACLFYAFLRYGAGVKTFLADQQRFCSDPPALIVPTSCFRVTTGAANAKDVVVISGSGSNNGPKIQAVRATGKMQVAESLEGRLEGMRDIRYLALFLFLFFLLR